MRELLSILTLCGLLLGACDKPTVYVGRRPDAEDTGDDSEPDGDEEVDLSDAGEEEPRDDEVLAPDVGEKDAGAPRVDEVDAQDAGAADAWDAGDPQGDERDAGQVDAHDAGSDDRDDRPGSGTVPRASRVTFCRSGLDCLRLPRRAYCELSVGVCIPCFTFSCPDRRSTTPPRFAP